MKKFIVTLLIAATTLSMGLSTAEAKRVGGGGSVGHQSTTVSRQAQTPAAPSQAARPAAPPAAPAAVPPKPASPWKGIVGGALLGLGAGALLSHLGLGSALGGMGGLGSMLGSLLMIGLLVMAGLFIYRMLKRRPAQDNAPAYAANYGGATPDGGMHMAQPEPMAYQGSASAAPAAALPHAPWGVPADFDTASFLRHAKTHFIRLQAAWDKADVNDVREFTTPEMYSELRMQMMERGSSPNNTDVVTLEAELLGIEVSGNEHVASVKFTGMIREAAQAPAEPFAEVWNLAKPIAGAGGWVLAGIQQLN